MVCDPNLSRGERTLRASVQRGLHQTAERPESTRELDQRRVPRTGVHELGHLGVQVHPDGRHASAPAARSSCTTRSTPTSGPASTRTRQFDFTTGALTQRDHGRPPERQHAERATHPARRAILVLSQLPVSSLQFPVLCWELEAGSGFQLPPASFQLSPTEATEITERDQHGDTKARSYRSLPNNSPCLRVSVLNVVP